MNEDGLVSAWHAIMFVARAALSTCAKAGLCKCVGAATRLVGG